MGLFKKKPQEAMPVGQALCIVDDDGWGFVNQQHHHAMDPDAIALLAPITFVIDEASNLHARGSAAVEDWLRTARKAAKKGAADFNKKVNPSGVQPIRDPGGAVPRGIATWGSFFITPSNHLVGQWRLTEGYRSDSHRARVLGVLLAAAEWREIGDALPHALEALADPRVDYNNPLSYTQLPQTALDYGVHQAALARMAAERPWETN